MTTEKPILITDIASAHGFTSVEKDALSSVHTASKNMVKRMMGNAGNVAKMCRVKTVKVDHLKLVENIMTGGRIVLPEAYFQGAETEGYFPKSVVAPYETITSMVNVATETRPSMDYKVLGGAELSKNNINPSFVRQTVQAMKIDVQIDKNAQLYISQKAVGYTSLLMTTIRKQYPKQNVLKGSMVKKVMDKNMIV